MKTIEKICFVCKKEIIGCVLEVNGTPLHWYCEGEYNKLPKKALTLDDLITKIKKEQKTV